MKLRLCLVYLLAAFCCVAANGAESNGLENNAELTEIVEQDQADRQPSYDGIDWDIVSPRDVKRRQRVLALLREGLVKTSDDFQRAGLVFQHGDTVEDARLAMSLAWVGASIDPDNDKAKWLSAAAWDRLLMYQGQPQWYGTQYRRVEGKWRLYTVQEDAVTDEQRQALNVPTLDETMERLKKRNQD